MKPELDEVREAIREIEEEGNNYCKARDVAEKVPSDVSARSAGRQMGKLDDIVEKWSNSGYGHTWRIL